MKDIIHRITRKKYFFLKFVMYYNVLCLKVKTTFVNYYFSSVDSLELYI